RQDSAVCGDDAEVGLESMQPGGEFGGLELRRLQNGGADRFRRNLHVRRLNPMAAPARAIGLRHDAGDDVPGPRESLERGDRERRRAEVDDPHDSPLPAALQLTNLSYDQVALDAAEVVEEQFAVEM